MATWFEYDYCRDLPAMRSFWIELVGLTPVWDASDCFALVHEDVQLVYTESGDTPLGPKAWAFQPGWSHGQLEDAPRTTPSRSRSVAIDPSGFRAAVTRLTAAGTPSLHPEPFWVGYWSFVVRDPDGWTVELSDPVSPGPEGA